MSICIMLLMTGIICGIGSMILILLLASEKIVIKRTDDITIISIICCVLILSLICIFIAPEYDNKYIEKINIESLHDGITSQGTFILGCGNINNDISYIVLIKESIGYKQQIIKNKFDNIILIETDDVSPHIEYVNYEFFKQSIYYADEVRIYIPIGTIIKNFNIDGY